MPKRLVRLSVRSIGVVTRGASGDAEHRPEVLLYKSASEAAQNKVTNMGLGDWVRKALRRKAEEGSPEAALETALAGLSDDQKEAIMGAVAMLLAAQAKPSEAEPVMEAAPEVAKSAEVIALEKRAADAEAALAKAREASDLAEVEAVAKACPHVPGDMAERVKTLSAIRKSSREAYDAIVVQLTAAEAALAKALAGEAGTTRSSEDAPKSRFEAEVAKAMEADPKLSRERAFARVAKSNKQLFTAMIAESR